MHDVKRFIYILSLWPRVRKGRPLPKKLKMLLGKILSGNEELTLIVMVQVLLNKYNHGPSVCWNCILILESYVKKKTECMHDRTMIKLFIKQKLPLCSRQEQLQQPTLWCSRKNMQRNKQVAMGRKKFNMDPKKVGGSYFQKCDLSFMFSLAGCNLGPCLFLRGSSFWLRMTCWRIPVMTLLNSSTRARASTKQPLEITLERGQDEDWLLFLYLTIFLSYSVSSFTSTHPCDW